MRQRTVTLTPKGTASQGGAQGRGCPSCHLQNRAEEWGATHTAREGSPCCVMAGQPPLCPQPLSGQIPTYKEPTLAMKISTPPLSASLEVLASRWTSLGCYLLSLSLSSFGEAYQVPLTDRNTKMTRQETGTQEAAPASARSSTAGEGGPSKKSLECPEWGQHARRVQRRRLLDKPEMQEMLEAPKSPPCARVRGGSSPLAQVITRAPVSENALQSLPSLPILLCVKSKSIQDVASVTNLPAFLPPCSLPSSPYGILLLLRQTMHAPHPLTEPQLR